jgi:hypothetical protein
LKTRINRRDLLRATSLLVAPAAFLRELRAAPALLSPAQTFNYAYVGTYTPNGGGIYLFRIDPVTAALTQL